ncbi:hypothetical protein [Arthrobacter sp. FB24]|uniref:hypothetical protein n=1 Tax=Arthrobacter sp. (strain FB24) TaxID=290399 RepID=UPI0012EA70FC|nr:hypothetical protein [Arthrobacter sp. FB24]
MFTTTISPGTSVRPVPADEQCLPVANPYATATNPELERHHWQNLAGMVASFRPGWPIDRILANLWDARNKQSFPELAHVALAVAMNPKYNGPGAIYLAAAAVIEL